MARAFKTVRVVLSLALVSLSLLVPAALARGVEANQAPAAPASLPQCSHNGQHDCWTHSPCVNLHEWVYVWNVYPTNLRNSVYTGCGIA